MGEGGKAIEYNSISYPSQNSMTWNKKQKQKNPHLFNKIECFPYSDNASFIARNCTIHL